MSDTRGNGDGHDYKSHLLFDLSGGATTIANAISGAGTVTFIGQEHYTLTGANSYGATRIAANNQVVVGNGGTTGSLGTGAVADAGALSFARSNGLTVKSAISGSGFVEQDGGGTTILSGTNIYFGGTLVEKGTLEAGDSGAFGLGKVTVDAGATLDLGGFSESFGALEGSGTVDNTGTAAVTLTENSATSSIFAGVIEGALGLLKKGASVLTLSGAKTFSVGAMVAGGTLQAGIANAFGTRGVTVDAGATLDLGGFAEDEAIASHGRVTGSKGVSTLGGAFVNDGVLATTGAAVIASKAVAGTGSASLSGGGSLTFDGAFNQAVAFSGAGSLTLTQNYTGAVIGFGAGDTISYANATGAKLSGSHGDVALNGSELSLTGSSDTISFTGTSSLTVAGASEAYDFGKTLGLGTITGFASSDVLHLSKLDWSSFSALQTSHDLSELNGNAVIKLGASDHITLVGVEASTLTTKNFVFA